MAYPTKDVEEQVKTIPGNPGVYRYYDTDGELLYIGKAKSLKKRVSSYFTKNQNDSARIRIMVSKIRNIEFSVVNSEFEALLLENNLIKKHQPKYNVNLKDGKTYPFITIKKERFPRVFSMRNRVFDGSEYYGPYSSVTRMKIIMDVLRQLFPIRTCTLHLSDENINAGKFKVCLEHQIGLCKGPCEALETEAEYNESIKQIRHILKGNYQLVVSHIKEQLALAAEQLQFEKAAEWKGKLELLENFTQKSTVVNPAINNVDVFNIYTYNKYSFVNYLKVVRGTIIQTHTVEFKSKLDETDEELLLFALTDIREKFNSTSREIFLPFEIDIEAGDLKFTNPKIGDKKTLLELSKKNAMAYAQQKLKAIEIKNPQKRTLELMERMKNDLALENQPHHIECFDNSNMQGSYPVSSCVVFKGGKPSKADYRIFNVKTVDQIDDFATMEEVVFRRYRRLKEEAEPLPNLIVIDGGKGQLGAALKSLEKLDLIGKIEIVGIAKRLEEIYKPGDPYPLHVDKSSDSLKVIQHLRNEAHRFAITGHRQRRQKQRRHSELDDIDGVGPKRRRELLTHFGGIKAIRGASREELAKVPGISQKLADDIYAALHD